MLVNKATGLMDQQQNRRLVQMLAANEMLGIVVVKSTTEQQKATQANMAVAELPENVNQPAPRSNERGFFIKSRKQ